MTLEDIKIEYRPLRVGFCVSDGNIKDLLLAARLNTLLWGGIYNPIIPVNDVENIDEKIVKLFQVDILVPITDSREVEEFIKKFEWAQLPSYQSRNSILAEDAYNRGKKGPVILDVSHIFRKLWQKDFKFSKDGSNCTLIKWKARDDDKNALTLNFGAYPKEKLVIQYEKEFKKALRAREIKVEEGKAIPPVLASVVSPLLLTDQDIKSYGRDFPRYGVFLGEENNFTDLVSFWNLRACGGSIIFLPKENIKRFASYAKAFVETIKKNSGNGKEFHMPVLTSGNRKAEYIEEELLLGALKIKDVKFGFGGISCHSWSDKNLKPSYVFFNNVTTIANINTSSGKPNVGIQLLDKPFLKTDERISVDQYFAVSIKPSFGIENSGYTTNLPVLSDLNEWYAREMIFEPFGLRATNDIVGKSVSLITEASTDTIQFSPIEKFELIQKIFERAGIKATKSGAGLVAERIISLMNGVNSSTRIFKITGVRKFITETSPLCQKSKHEIIKIIRDITPNGETFKKFEKEFGLKIGPVTPENVFATMTERNLLKAGIEIKCPKCGLSSWIDFKKIDEFYECEFCFEKSRLIDSVKPYAFKGENIDGVKWSYRLSGILGKGDKQQGSIPVILTLSHLANRMHFGIENNYTTALELILNIDGEEKRVETDLVVFGLDQRLGKEDIEILIGECKTGQAISDKQIEGLILIKNELEKSGIKCYLVFTTLKEKFSNSEIKRFKKLYESGVRPLLFTVNELEPWHDVYKHYKTTIENFKLPFEHPFTFEDLAQNSAYIYGLKSN